ncbi:MAG: ABC-2 family transporter protein, partial [Candidatus Latescibacteria bacterium]|nr:ABC-2 family transporter protein [Candidatus Latescibacterota bacterium]
LYSLWYTRMLAMRTAPTLLRSIPLLAITGLFFGLGSPPSWASALAFVLSLLGALLMGCAISCLLAISLFWTISGQGLNNLLMPAIFVFSGMLVPLPLLPDWAQPLLNALPFRGLVDVPFRLYTGHIPPAEVLPLFGFQLAWALALVLLGHRILARGTRRLVVQGG